ncbi:hypothetical protein BJ138DRAFT_1013452 [Hygrophoropsis aurantiaca]|uniref:Uncharacterized protein n=1 Tax=Hygrophoropsis aurantiaca TaxID=72124 RepID=A0ACB8A4G4_9AGAM|nr:hypothetical protein BJ138DRAFT_1013452 [Hygrophoropsis aurantiaca]
MGKTNLSTLRLRGIVYHGAFHFTAAIIDTDSKVWFYDGAKSSELTDTGKYLTEQVVDSFFDSWDGRVRCLAIYAKDV